MYQRRTERGDLNKDFIEGLETFIEFACSKPDFMDGTKIRCPCKRCHHISFEEAETVRFHLCKYGFVPNYFEWNRHGEKSRNSTSMGFDANWSLNNEQNEPLESYQQMVIDAAGQNLIARNVGEEPNAEDKKFFDMLDAADRQLWSGCEKLTQLSAVARLLNIKTEYRLPEQCFDAFCQLFKDGLPEDNNMVDSFYQTKKLIQGLGLPVEKIDCCRLGCMLYWGDDKELNQCKFCQQPSMKRDKVDWLVVCKVQPRGWIESFKKENGQTKDVAFQEKEVEDTEIASSVDGDSFVRLSDENVEYIDIANDNSDNEEENDELEFDSTSRPLSPSTPSTATNGQAGQDVVRQVHGRIRIDVKGNMLTNSDVCARKITKLFKERTDPNGYTWGQLSVDTVEFYWEEFKKSFDWDDAKTTLVYNAWEMKAKIKYADYISRLRKNSRHVYISPEIWTKWNEVWNSEEGKKKTELAKKNRRGGVLNGVAQSTHTTRSTPHVKVVAQLKRRIYGLGSYGCSIVNGSTSDNTSGNMTPTSRPPDNATPASVQDEIQSLKATILLMQQRLDAIDGGRAGTSSSPPSQTD
nr:uncharacterized protein LOC109166774 [Ipomoea batatas]